jgi:hypothetical protein
MPSSDRTRRIIARVSERFRVITSETRARLPMSGSRSFLVSPCCSIRNSMAATGSGVSIMWCFASYASTNVARMSNSSPADVSGCAPMSSASRATAAAWRIEHVLPNLSQLNGLHRTAFRKALCHLDGHLQSYFIIRNNRHNCVGARTESGNSFLRKIGCCRVRSYFEMSQLSNGGIRSLRRTLLA